MTTWRVEEMYQDKHDSTKWILPLVLKAQAERDPDRPFVVGVGEGTLTYAQAEDAAARVAGYLESLGVGPGDRVVLMCQPGLDFIRLWTGIGRLGAIMVAINTGLQGPILESQVIRSRAALAVVDQECIPAFAQVLPAAVNIQKLVTTGPLLSVEGSECEVRRFDEWRSAPRFEGAMPIASDIAAILYTSGTTGPSKGVLMPHAHCYLYGLGFVESCDMTPDDRHYQVLPLYHVNGLLIQVYGCLIAGATVILRRRFSATEWLNDIIEHEATITVVVGAIIPFLFGQPESPRDRQHKLRLIGPGPKLVEHEKVWRDRFGVPEYISGFGMTEANIFTWEKIGMKKPGSMGKAYAPYFDVRIVDPGTDRFLPPNMVGEIVVRPNEPHCFMAGYDEMPDQTVAATRNLWFHTGDAGRLDEDGFLYFIDRLKDRIRRRGENVSSYEVEEALERMEAVKEVACFAVPSDIDDGEDEIMVAVVPHPGMELSPQDVARFAAGILPKFCRPRYILIDEPLPRTKTEKVQRNLLRQRGLTAGTYDTSAQPVAS